MHTKFKINIIPRANNDTRASLENIQETMRKVDGRPYNYRSLERGPGAYLLINELKDARFWLCFLQLRFSETFTIYLVDSPRYKAVVLKGANTKAKGDWLPNHKLTEKLAEKHSNVVSAQRLLNKDKQPTGAVKVSFLGEVPTKILGLGNRTRSEIYVPPAPRCHKCHGFHRSYACKATEPVKCPKCGGDHDEAQCKNRHSCVNCGGAHHAYYPQCPENKRHKAAHLTSLTEGISYATAVKKTAAISSTVQRPPTAQIVKTVSENVTDNVNAD
ncbi:hypothetical protein FSP39_019130 [Pinctada imbricata]|uniref:Nucleic-acid-binding protein from transposon X-element n=1 Tax=Pinctada imbricata TaxID=66713 RepID=A0AA88YKY8_PINIB|nr:hypothetical protein FSP39_019130 [Pinctada imbricata]